MRLLGKVLILVLVFTLGFASAFGALFGAGYYAYTNVTLDSAGVNTDNIFDKDAAEVQLSAMSIEQFVAEIQALQGISDKLSLDMLIARYGLKIPDEIVAVVPASARALPLAELFSEDGIMAVLDELYIGQLLSYEMGEPIPGKEGEYNWYFAGTTTPVTGLYTVLVNYTIADLINQNFDINIIMEKLTIATVLNLHSDKYCEVYINDKGNLIPVLDLPEEISVWRTSQGAKVSSTIAALADIPVSELSTSLDDISVASLLGFIQYSDDFYSYEISNVAGKEVLVLSEQTGITAALSDLNIADFSNGGINDKIQEIKICDVLGYTYNEDDGKYYDSYGKAVNGALAMIVGSSIGNINADINGVMIGEICGFTKVEDEDGKITWYSKYSKEDPSKNVKAEGIMVSIADLTIDQLSDNNAITSRIETLTVADALGYKLSEDGKSYVDKNGKPVGGVIGVIAGSQLNSIQGKIDESTIGELFGYTKVGDDWYTKEANGELKKVTGVMSALANSSIGSIGDDINDIKIGDVCGFTEVGDVWYSDYFGEDDPRNVIATGVMASIAGSTISNINEDINNVLIGDVCGFTKVGDKWYSEYYGENDSRNVVAKGVMASMANSTVGNIDENVNSILVGDACGFTKVDETWYSEYYGENDNRNVIATGVMAAIADSTIASIGDDINSVLIGDVCGFTKVDDTWYSEYYGENDDRNVIATGIMASIADSTISNIDEDVNDILVGDACGFTKVGDTWYSEYYGVNDSRNVKATGVMASIANSTIGTIDDDINGVLVGDVCGYTKVDDVWYTKNADGELVKATGVMASIADATIGNIDEKVNDILVGDACGFTEDDGVWYSEYYGKGDDRNVVATGVMAAIAGSKLGTINDDINGVLVGDVCGYTQIGETWYTKGEDGELVKVSGVMAAIAGSTIGSIDEDIDNVLVGDVYGYTKIVDEEGKVTWYSEYYGEGHEDNVIATGAIAAIANSTIGNIDKEINTMRIGDACGFTKVGVNWYSEYYGPNYPDLNKKATGVMAKLADLTIEDLNDNNKITAKIETLTVADALGYTLDAGGNYLDKEGNPVSGVMGVLAGTELSGIQTKVDDTEIGKITGFTKIGDTWYTDAEGTTEAGGIMSAIADLKVSDLKDNGKLTECIESLTVADALGYTLDDNGNYVDKEGNAVSGVMGVLAGTKLNGIQGTVDNTEIGKITGFTNKDGKWYTDAECTTEAGGIMNAIADLTVSDLKDSSKLSAKIQTIKVADALGYTTDASGNYVDKNGNPVSGVMAVIAGTELAGIQNKVDTSLTGELMGLTPVYGVDGETIVSWKDKNGAPVHVLMNKIASTPFTDIGGLTDNLAIGDIIPDSQREGGFMSLIDEDTQLDEIGPEVNRVFTETKLCEFVKKDIIKITGNKEAFVDDDGNPGPLGNFTLNELMESLASGNIIIVGK